MQKINKLLGLYELKSLSLPSMNWVMIDDRFDKNILKNHMLWTARTAVIEGNDICLPKKICANADEVLNFIETEKDKNQETVIFIYPFFYALKSGTLNVSLNSLFIEGVYKDLWNMNSERIDYSFLYEFETKNSKQSGNQFFLTDSEKEAFIKHSIEVKSRYRSVLCEGTIIQLEWSFAVYDRNLITPEEYELIFYELRTLA